MPNRSWLARRIAAVAVCALLTAAAAHAYSAMREANAFKDTTATRVFKHQIGHRGAHLRARLMLTAGKAAVISRDGGGAVVWQRDFTPGNVVGEADVDGAEGNWQVELALDHATGRYDISLRQR